MRSLLKITGVLIGVILLSVIVLLGYANVQIHRTETLTVGPKDLPGRFLEIDGRRWHLVTMGELSTPPPPSRPPILLIHGFAIPGHVTFLPWAHRLEKDRALIIPDLLGYGYSERNSVPGPYYSLHGYAASLVAMLDSLGVETVDVVGHSFGGAIAAQLAADYPTRVRRIVFIAAAVYAVKSPVLEALIQMPAGIGRAVAWNLFGDGPISIIHRYCLWQGGEDCSKTLRLRGTIDTVRAMMFVSRHTPDLDSLPTKLPQLHMPALVIWGTEDRIVPIASGQRLASQLKARFETVSGAGHMPYQEQPDQVKQLTLQFLDQQ